MNIDEKLFRAEYKELAKKCGKDFALALCAHCGGKGVEIIIIDLENANSQDSISAGDKPKA